MMNLSDVDPLHYLKQIQAINLRRETILARHNEIESEMTTQTQILGQVELYVLQNLGYRISTR